MRFIFIQYGYTEHEWRNIRFVGDLLFCRKVISNLIESRRDANHTEEQTSSGKEGTDREAGGKIDRTKKRRKQVEQPNGL